MKNKRNFSPGTAVASRRERVPGRPVSSSAQASDKMAQLPLRPEHGRQRLYGFHTVAEALRNPRRKIESLYVTENAVQRLADMAPEMRPVPIILRPGDLDRLVPANAVHQGVVA